MFSVDLFNKSSSKMKFKLFTGTELLVFSRPMEVFFSPVLNTYSVYVTKSKNDRLRKERVRKTVRLRKCSRFYFV